tara:strand:- start:114 stop:248 length:135 start_codon:yes stop_codon:yes gene_type:complete
MHATAVALIIGAVWDAGVIAVHERETGRVRAAGAEVFIEVTAAL